MQKRPLDEPSKVKNILGIFNVALKILTHFSLSFCESRELTPANLQSITPGDLSRRLMGSLYLRHEASKKDENVKLTFLCEIVE
jgi:hypothetical protein